MNLSQVVVVMTIRPAKYTLILFFLSLLFPCTLRGQQKDFQSWWELKFDKGLGNGFDLSAEIEQRFKNNSLQYDRSLVTVTGEYGLNDYLDVAAGIRTFLDSNREMQLNVKYRLHMETTGRYSLTGLNMSLRLRFQYGFEDLIDPAYLGDNNFVNRNRLKVASHIFGTRIWWFGSVESWHLWNDQPNRLFYKMRYSAGVGYALNFISEISVRYILEDEFNVTKPLQSHVLVVGYSHNL